MIQMNSIEEAIAQVESLIRVLNKNKSKQVESLDERSIVKATAFSWFQNIRPKTNLKDEQFVDTDDYFKFLLEAAERKTSRNKYHVQLKSLRKVLIKLRSDNIITFGNSNTYSSENPPNFSSLIKDEKMRSILINRWNECTKCIEADAPLSSLIMMGGMLEAILLARINAHANKAEIINSKSAPIDKKTSKVSPLQEWTLKNYIDVSRELNWITQSTKDIGEVLRDYRNYIHPYKELSHGIKISKSDAELFWQITKSIINQLLIIK